MGILPLQFTEGTSMASLGLTGEETFDIAGLDAFRAGEVPKEITVRAGDVEFSAAGSHRHARWRPSTSATAGSWRTCCASSRD